MRAPTLSRRRIGAEQRLAAGRTRRPAAAAPPRALWGVGGGGGGANDPPPPQPPRSPSRLPLAQRIFGGGGAPQQPPQVHLPGAAEQAAAAAQEQEEELFFPTRDPAFASAAGVAPPLAGDWRLFRAQLVARERGATPGAAGYRGPGARLAAGARWAHALGAPEPGCLLVARPGAPLGAPVFERALVLVLDHGRWGSTGIVLNQPLVHAGRGFLVADLLDRSDAGGAALGAALGGCPLLHGGPVARAQLHVLHGRADVGVVAEPRDDDDDDGGGEAAGDGEWTAAGAGGGAGAGDAAMRQPLPGVFSGGMRGAAAAVAARAASPREFRLLAGYAGWGPGQLDAEVAGGAAWTAVAAGQALVLDVMNEVGGYDPRRPGSAAAADALKTATWERVRRAAGLA